MYLLAVNVASLMAFLLLYNESLCTFEAFMQDLFVLMRVLLFPKLLNYGLVVKLRGSLSTSQTRYCCVHPLGISPLQQSISS